MQTMSKSIRRAIYRLFSAAVLLAGVCGCGPEHVWNGAPVSPVEAAPPLVGTNWDGSPFALEDLKGKIAVISFGYTFCPDVCPFTLYRLQQLYQQLGDRAEQVAVVFVSVDPHRDTREKLADYVPGFDRRFYGLRLEFDELDTVIEDWDLTVQYGQPKDGPGSDSFYYVDHTGSLFVTDLRGRLRLTFPANARVDELLPDIEELLAESGSR